MDILYIVPYVPDLVRVRPYNLIRYLSARGHRVSVATLWSNEAELAAVEKLKKECFKVHALKLTKKQILINCALTLPTGQPLQASYCWQPEFARLVAGLVRQEEPGYDVIHVEHLRGARYGLHLKTILQSLSTKRHIPIVWDSVDCISLLFQQAARKSASFTNRMITRFETGRTLAYESRLVNQFERILVTSSIDKKAFLAMGGANQPQPEITVIPNGVDLEYFKPDPGQERERAALVLSGKMSYHANIAMAHHLVQQIMPVIWAQKPETVLWIVGKDPPESIRKLGENPRVVVTGTVPDLRPYLQKATLAVAPITYGAGIQNKVLEAMACGTPVIASSQAASALSALPGSDLLIADEPARFAQAALDLLNDLGKQNAIGSAGYEYVLNHHDWGEIASRLEKAYLETIKRMQ